MFELLKQISLGRRGRLHTAHGVIESPFFMPVGTAGAMRGITMADLEALGAQILLCNTYHLHLRPGEDIVAEAGGLHGFAGWDKPILTDSGGYQVFSLRGISKITDAGVQFQSHINGDTHFIGPEEAMQIQHKLGADIIMAFDHCPPSTAKRSEIVAAVDRTLRWAARCKKEHERLKALRMGIENGKLRMENGGSRTREGDASGNSQFPLLFGIVQGGLEPDLRKKCAEELIAIGFDGYAIGGLAVGETPNEMFSVLDTVLPVLPANSARYLMGVGRISQMAEAVRRGIDMFDCVMPMREARHGNLFLSDGTTARIRNAAFVRDHSFIDPDSPSPLSRRHTKAYLRHLTNTGERYGETIACLQNMGVTLRAMRELRERIEN